LPREPQANANAKAADGSPAGRLRGAEERRLRGRAQRASSSCSSRLSERSERSERSSRSE